MINKLMKILTIFIYTIKMYTKFKKIWNKKSKKWIILQITMIYNKNALIILTKINKILARKMMIRNNK